MGCQTYALNTGPSLGAIPTPPLDMLIKSSRGNSLWFPSGSNNAACVVRHSAFFKRSQEKGKGNAVLACHETAWKIN